MPHKNFLGRALLTCTMASGLLLAVGMIPLSAARNDDNERQNRISKAQADVDKNAADMARAAIKSRMI